MPIKLPFYAKASLLLVGLYALFSILYIAQGLIVPFIFAVILSIVLHPVVNFFVGLRINRILSIVITLILAFLLVAALGGFFISQGTRFSESFPLLMDKLTEIINETTTWASKYFNISPQKIIAWVAQTKGDLIDSSGATIGKTIITVGNTVVLLFLIPVYVFMLLYFHPLILEFLRRIFGKSNRTEVSQIISNIKSLIQQYLIGLMAEAGIIAALYITGLLLLGIEYAVLLAVIGALLNMIPYIGAIIAAVLPMIMAIVSKPNPWSALLVLAIYIFIQFIDNNILVPRIVASKVKINALVSIIAVLAYGALWGIPGMFLSIPLTAIFKLIFDRIDSLKPWGYLLGDTLPELPVNKTNQQNNN